jgi:hypothetical protein
MAKRILEQYLLNHFMCFINYTLYTHTHSYTILKYMQTHKNECEDILSDYPVHCLPTNTKQLSAHSVHCMHWCLFRWLC